MTEFFNEKYDDDDELISKSQIKRELLAIKELGRELVELPNRDLAKLNLDQDLLDHIIKAKGLSHGALKRQIGFIGGLLAHEDTEHIQANLTKLRQAHNGEVKQFHQIEQWRDQLLAGDDAVMPVLLNQFDGFDIQHVRQLVRNATKEANQNKPPKSARVLFKYLQQCQSEQD
ncbi:MAG: ribosome biogenesis factor YjgA [Gammaproteobacteria bacterium]|nr:ribosome biogenesis factor YjgA [Gammaproteobacteria bacterium]